MIGVDTNVLLRWVANDVVGADDARNQSILVEEMIAANVEPIFLNKVVLVEAIWVLKRRAPKQALIDVMTGLLNAINVIIEDREAVLSALDAYIRYPGDFADHLIGQGNQFSGCRTTFTFDKAAARSPNFSELQR